MASTYNPRDYVRDYSWIAQAGSQIAAGVDKASEIFREHKVKTKDLYDGVQKHIYNMPDKVLHDLGTTKAEMVKLAPKPQKREDPRTFAQRLSEWYKPITSRMEAFGISKQDLISMIPFGIGIDMGPLGKEAAAEKKASAVATGAQEVAQGLSAPQAVPETGMAPPQTQQPSPPELAGLGGGPPAQQPQPRSSSPIPQTPGVLGADTGQFQQLSTPPESQEQFLGDFAERQAQDPALAGVGAQQALGTPAGAQFRPEKELFAEGLKVKRETRIAEDAQTRKEQRNRRLNQLDRSLEQTIADKKKTAPEIGKAVDSLYRVINKSKGELNAAINKADKELEKDIADWGDDSNEAKRSRRALEEKQAEQQAINDVKIFVVNKYTADLTPNKVDLAISLAQEAIQNKNYNGIEPIFKQLRVQGGAGQPVPAAPATPPAGGLGAPAAAPAGGGGRFKVEAMP